jgi:hypothetical protein
MKKVLMLVIMLSLTAAGIYKAGAAVAAGQSLLLFYSNDVAGETEPCG